MTLNLTRVVYCVSGYRGEVVRRFEPDSIINHIQDSISRYFITHNEDELRIAREWVFALQHHIEQELSERGEDVEFPHRVSR